MSKPPIIQINKTPVFVSSEIIKPTIRLKTSPLELKTSISSFNLKTNHSITRQIHTSQNSVIKPKEISDKNSSNYNKINDFFENE